MSTYTTTLPLVFPWLARRVPQELAGRIAQYLAGTDEGLDSPLSAGSSFAIVAGITYAKPGFVDLWASDVSHRRVQNVDLGIGLSWQHLVAEVPD